MTEEMREATGIDVAASSASGKASELGTSQRPAAEPLLAAVAATAALTAVNLTSCSATFVSR